MRCAVFVVMLLAATVVLAQAQATKPLFFIERSKNRNVVHYDAQLTQAGKLDPKRPVIAYWIMLSEDGRREDLNWLERHKAYGFRVEPDNGRQVFRLWLMAYPEREIKVYQNESRVVAEMRIDGNPALLERIYIASTEGIFLPTVKYVELFGRDLNSNEERYEKIVPK
jgi:hypothetical protein